MTRKTTATTAEKTATRTGQLGHINVPPEYITIVADAKPSAYYAEGTQFLKALAHGRDLPAEYFAPLGFPCYDAAPGSTITLTITFHNKDKKHRPKGLLRLRTDRGKLSDTFVKLDGKHEQIKIQYTAPDETIKVSIRAFLDGHGRGKAHFHLG